MIFDIDLNLMLTFFAAFVTFLLVYRLLEKKEEIKDNETILAERVANLAKQQDVLLESNNERISTFQKSKSNELVQGDGTDDTLREKIATIMRKASITDISIDKFIIICAIGGTAMSGVVVYFNFLHYLSGVPIGFAVGSYLAYAFLAYRADRKKQLFLSQLPDAIDMMIRGVKAGLNVNRVMKLVSLEASDPIASEYLAISQKLDLGVRAEVAFTEAAEKIDIDEFRFLVVALILQMENGGVLAEILTNLATIIRKRLELQLKMKAMSAEARTSAVVLSALPFAFSGIMALVNPGHLSEFMNPGIGQTLLKVTIILFSLGVFFMLRATKIKV